MKDWQQYIIPENQTIKQALELLDRISITVNVLFVVNDKGKLTGSVTDGDIRRALLKGISIGDSIKKAMFTNFRSFQAIAIDIDKAKAYKDYGIRFIPLIDVHGKMVDLLDVSTLRTVLPIDVVIMAGGKGERLLPLTKEVPKPLLKVGEKPIIEHNIDRFIQYGIRNIHISINYLGSLIQDYFGDGKTKRVKIKYLSESEPLGTIGILGNYNDFENEEILIMNSDLLTNIDFEEFYNYFKDTQADMAVATVPHNVDLPYAILEVDDKKVISLKEKPTYTYFANAGIYLVKKKVLQMIPRNTYFDATDLMEKLVQEKSILVQYPILAYWLDIGRINDYQKAQEDIKIIKF